MKLLLIIKSVLLLTYYSVLVTSLSVMNARKTDQQMQKLSHANGEESEEELLPEIAHVMFHELKLRDRGTLTLILPKFTDC